MAANLTPKQAAFVSDTASMEPTDLADILRDEADRLNKSANKFSGWQAVADSLVRLADALGQSGPSDTAD